MSIKVRCITNLDSFKNEIWPIEMEARPIKGDLVRSEGGKMLEVASIIHTTYKGRATDAVGNHEMHPIIEVYLGK